MNFKKHFRLHQVAYISSLLLFCAKWANFKAFCVGWQYFFHYETCQICTSEQRIEPKDACRYSTRAFYFNIFHLVLFRWWYLGEEKKTQNPSAPYTFNIIKKKREKSGRSTKKKVVRSDMPRIKWENYQFCERKKNNKLIKQINWKNSKAWLTVRQD